LHTWEDNIKIDVKETGWKGIGWILPALDTKQLRALVNAVMKLQVSSNAVDFAS
jgi:hypothetical protein